MGTGGAGGDIWRRGTSGMATSTIHSNWGCRCVLFNGRSMIMEMTAKAAGNTGMTVRTGSTLMLQCTGTILGIQIRRPAMGIVSNCIQGIISTALTNMAVLTDISINPGPGAIMDPVYNRWITGSYIIVTAAGSAVRNTGGIPIKLACIMTTVAHTTTAPLVIMTGKTSHRPPRRNDILDGGSGGKGNGIDRGLGRSVTDNTGILSDTSYLYVLGQDFGP